MNLYLLNGRKLFQFVDESDSINWWSKDILDHSNDKKV